MTDLTDKWKKGELPSGYYYVKNEFDNIFPSDYSEEYDSINDVVVKDFWTEVSDIVEVLAPVPSYDELQNINRSVNDLMASNIKLVEENTKLKELLKECRDVMDKAGFMFAKIDDVKKAKRLLKRIDEVLGEDK